MLSVGYSFFFSYLRILQVHPHHAVVELDPDESGSSVGSARHVDSYHSRDSANINNICMRLYMLDRMTKVISLSDEAYTKLKAMKLERESFSDTVNRLCKRTGSLLEILDMYPDLKDIGGFETTIAKDKDYVKDQDEKMMHELS